MMKIKNAAIAALALVSFALPGAAYAGKIGQEIKELRSDIHDTRDQKHDLKESFKNGTSGLTRQQYRDMMKQYSDQVQDIQDQVGELVDQRASQ